MAKMTRRQFLRTGAGAAAAVSLAPWLAACGEGGDPGLTTSTSVTPSALEDLRKRLKGTLLLPGDQGYGPASAESNGRWLGIRPEAVAICADESDVATCVKWSRENGVPVAVRGQGHSYGGFSTTTGLVISLERFNQVALDLAAGTAVVGGAATVNDIFTALENKPFLIPVGTCPDVGVGGLTLGGGMGYNTHWAGLTCDRLRSSRIVTASGDMLQIDDTDNPDLYWACRGGAGGNFGINTSFTFELVPVPATVGYYRFEWMGADAAGAVLAAFDTIQQTAPAALNAVVETQAKPVAPGGGPRDAVYVMSRGQYVGPLAELQDLLKPLLAAAPPTTQVVQEVPFWTAENSFKGSVEQPHSWGDISRYSKDPVPADVFAKIADMLADCPSRSADANGAFWTLGWVGGPEVAKFAPTDTAYVHRNVTSLLRPTIVWPNNAPASVGNDLVAWAAACIALIAPHTPNQSYQNFPNLTISDWQQAYYAENFPRLVDVKTAYDKDNVFHYAQSIPPKK
jgi:FAD/FMN-containing dehydrogenase